MQPKGRDNTREVGSLCNERALPAHLCAAPRLASALHPGSSCRRSPAPLAPFIQPAPVTNSKVSCLWTACKSATVVERRQSGVGDRAWPVAKTRSSTLRQRPVLPAALAALPGASLLPRARARQLLQPADRS